MDSQEEEAPPVSRRLFSLASPSASQCHVFTTNTTGQTRVSSPGDNYNAQQEAKELGGEQEKPIELVRHPVRGALDEEKMMIMTIRGQRASAGSQPAGSSKKLNESRKSGGEPNEEADCVGQLVLNVDFAPPKRSPILTTGTSDNDNARTGFRAATNYDNDRSSELANRLATSGPTIKAGSGPEEGRSVERCKHSSKPIGGHLIELSLCVKQKTQSNYNPPVPPPPPPETSTTEEDHNKLPPCDNDKPQALSRPERLDDCVRRRQLAQTEPLQDNKSLVGGANNNIISGPGYMTAAMDKKKRLIYERIDKCSLLIGRRFDWGQPAAASNLTLPFKSATFDACFCFNLLSIRVASVRLLAIEEAGCCAVSNPQQPAAPSSSSVSLEPEVAAPVKQAELEQSWLVMEKLTSELRLALLRELRRVVRPKGQVMVCVFAYECNSPRAGESGTRNCKQEQTTDAGRPANGDRETPAPADLPTSAKTTITSTTPSELVCKQNNSDKREASPANPETHREEPKEDEDDSCCPRCRLELIERRLRTSKFEKFANQSSQSSKFKLDDESSKQPEGGDNEYSLRRRRASRDAAAAAAGRQTKRRFSEAAPRPSKLANGDMHPERLSLYGNRWQDDLENKDNKQAAGSETCDSINKRSENRTSLAEGNLAGAASTLWKVMRKGSNIGDELLAASSKQFQTITNAADSSLGEAAKRLSRRLSLGGSSLLSRLLSNATTGGSQDEPNSFKSNFQSESRCDIKVEPAEFEIRAEEPESSSAGTHLKSTDLNQKQSSRNAFFASADALELFQDGDFARRHRQSIAVRSFFTKSIEVTADEEELFAGTIVPCASATEPETEADQSVDCLPAKITDSYELATRLLSSFERAYGDEEELEEDDLEFTLNDDSTTSGWTAPTTNSTATNLESSTASATACNRAGRRTPSRLRNSWDVAEPRGQTTSGACRPASSSGGSRYVECDRCISGSANKASSAWNWSRDNYPTSGMNEPGPREAEPDGPGRRSKQTTGSKTSALSSTFDGCLSSATAAAAATTLELASGWSKQQTSNDNEPVWASGRHSVGKQIQPGRTNTPTSSSRGPEGEEPSNIVHVGSSGAQQAGWPAPPPPPPPPTIGSGSGSGLGNDKEESDRINSDFSSFTLITTTTATTATTGSTSNENSSSNGDDNNNTNRPADKANKGNIATKNHSTRSFKQTNYNRHEAENNDNTPFLKRHQQQLPAPNRYHPVSYFGLRGPQEGMSGNNRFDCNADRAASGTVSGPGVLASTLDGNQQQQQQRRAFSETEAYTAASKFASSILEGAGALGAVTSFEFINHPSDRHRLGGSNRPNTLAQQLQGNALPANLISCPNPGQIETLQSLVHAGNQPLASTTSFCRQVRSAEPTATTSITHYNSMAIVSYSSSNTSTSSNTNQYNRPSQRRLSMTMGATFVTGSGGDRTTTSNSSASSGGGMNAPTTTTSGSRTSTSTDNPSLHNSASQLIGGGGLARAPPLPPAPLHGYMALNQDPPGAFAANEVATGSGNHPQHHHGRFNSQQYSKYQQQQQQQWCTSNTFSSSLNSDISTSASGPKDTTDKDSSRRTSTLSGISSIYQQEISLGFGTPHSVSLAGVSTPANSSQAAACSNMGSIPELASVEPTGALAQLKSNIPAQTEGTRLKQSSQPTDSLLGDNPLDNQLPEEAPTGQQQQARQQQQPISDFESLANSINLQKVASSLRSQLRERLSTMRTFNSLMGSLAPTPTTSAPSAEVILEEASGNQEIESLGVCEESALEELAGDQQQEAFAATTINVDQPSRLPYQPALRRDVCPSSPLSASLTSRASKTETPTPATLKSFFRSTSSAAFNAFASSFQSTGSQATPTPVSTPHLTPGSRQTLRHQLNPSGSLSSEVFDPPSVNLTGPGQPLGQQPVPLPRGGFSSSSGCLSHNAANQSPTNLNPPSDSQRLRDSPTAATESQRSPLSPISVTSSRFFARIRDKFNLSPASSSSTPRPNSSLSTSTATTVAQQPASSTPVEKKQPDEAKNELERLRAAESSRRTVDLRQAETERDIGSHKESHLSSVDLREDTFSLNESLESGPELNSTTTTSSSNKINNEPIARDQQQLPSKSSRVNNRKQEIKRDSYEDDYQNILNSRRPSLQRQLDEQVNQVYRIAVERKLQNSPIGPMEFFESLNTNSPYYPAGALGLAPPPPAAAAATAETTSNFRDAPTAAGSKQIGGSDLDSIIRPVSLMNPANYYVPPMLDSSIYLPQGAAAAFSANQASTATKPGQNQLLDRRPWIDSSQQSIDSSSSARSLRSCWFSMPELYAMNTSDSQSQSPSGGFAGCYNLPAGPTDHQSLATMNQLLGALSGDLLAPEPPTGSENAPGENANSKEPTGVDVGAEWPSTQLYKQVTTSVDKGQNWSLSDLNLTSDDINVVVATKPTGSAPSQQQQPGTSSGGPLAKEQAEKLMKTGTLDDSVCASIKSSSSVGCGDLAGEAKNQETSRPTSQNSTISNNSCPLSDLNSGDFPQPTNQQPEQWTLNSTPSVHSSSSANVSPISGGGDCQEQQKSKPPKCMVTNTTSEIEEPPKRSESPFKQDELQLLKAEMASKQRAMSLFPTSPLNATNLTAASDRSKSPEFDGGLLKLPINMGTPIRRRSAMGIMLPSRDIAPAATTLDLRLPSRRSRVKLTDLHPVTFINDKEFLSSMNSLKKADDTKLNAIFNCPVGRRLSINAEMNQHSPFNQPKSGIKIGLTGYVYINDKDQQRLGDLVRGGRGPGNFRRPSLAPSFWRAQQAQNLQDASPTTPAPDTENLSGKSRPRAASYTPSWHLATSPQPLNGRSPTSPVVPVKRPLFPAHPRPTITAKHLGADLSRRRSTITKLKKLTESSIEIDPDQQPDSHLKKSDENSNQNAHKVPSGSGDSNCNSSRNDSDNASADSDSDHRRSSSEDTSSDDGDIDKLVQQYGGASDTNASSVTPSSFGYTSGQQHHYGRAQSLAAACGRSRNLQSNPRVVKNDMIIKQLLLATANAAAATGNHHYGPSNGPFERQIPKEMRRFSAINLYQRDENVFVANSMKRPPNACSQIQALNTLAGTLPVLQTIKTASHHEINTNYNQMPVLQQQFHGGARTLGIKSIISGSSGLNVQEEASENNKQQQKLLELGKSSSISSSLVAEVDVEEQLNRLRQQERRSMAFASSSTSNGHQHVFSSDYNNKDPQDRAKLISGSSSGSSSDWTGPEETDEDSNADLMGDVTVPSRPTIPAILQPPGERHIAPRELPLELKPEVFVQLEETVELDSSCSQQTPKANPQAVISSPSSTPSTLLIGVSRNIPPVVELYSPGNKSCEPFKQLDTIIEGRGLLLGAEQQADPTYANRLRRLSGNHSRRSSFSNNQPQDQTNCDDWCTCDLASPNRKLSPVSKLNRRRGVQNQEHAGKSSEAAMKSSPPTRISTSSKYVLDTVKSLARRTFNNFTTNITVSPQQPDQQVKSAKETVLPLRRPISIPQHQFSLQVEDDKLLTSNSRQQRSSSMVVQRSNWGEQSINLQPTLPSRLLREKILADKDKQEARREQRSAAGSGNPNADELMIDDDDYSETSSTTTTSVTGSPDDDSLISLDDAENYRTKNKDNKMAHGRSLESSSSTSSESLSTQSTVSHLDGDPLDKSPKEALAISKRRSTEEVEDEEEIIEYDDNEDEPEAPKVCYKCNKSIRMEFCQEDEEDFEDEDDDDDEDGEKEEVELAKLQSAVLADNSADPKDPFPSGIDSQQAISDGLQAAGSGGVRHKATPVARNHHGRRRAAAARRSVSMNSAEPETAASGAIVTGGGYFNRRKNKWQIQRNLAPKLKRQRSFSANYAPEVPNPVMPPPRRFSAAPTLTCPHRNKSSSLSSSSIHQTYSIDSSESMITVIPAKGCLYEERTSRGSLSCNSGQGTDLSGSFYALPRSPLSPRSPSRCSPNLLTPSTSEPQTVALEPPCSPGTTTTCSSTTFGPNTVIYNNNNRDFQIPQSQQVASQCSAIKQQLLSEGQDNLASNTGRQFIRPSPSDNSCHNLSLDIGNLVAPRSSSLIFTGEGDNLSMAVENGTSYNSSRNELSEDLNFDTSFHTDLDSELLIAEGARDISKETLEFNYQPYDAMSNFTFKIDDLPAKGGSGGGDDNNGGDNDYFAKDYIDPDEPMIRETINEFCARHTREELEFLIGQIGYLKIRDCYFSKESSTLCMIIEIQEQEYH